jgi:cell division protein FtsN
MTIAGQTDVILRKETRNNPKQLPKVNPKRSQQQYISSADSQLPTDRRTERTASSKSTRQKSKNELTDQSPTNQDESVLATLPHPVTTNHRTMPICGKESEARFCFELNLLEDWLKCIGCVYFKTNSKQDAV